MTSLDRFAIALPGFGLLLAYGYTKLLNRQDTRDAARAKAAKDDADGWKQTVRMIYDELHFGSDSVFQGQQRLARRTVGMIEARHSNYFCATTEMSATE